MFLSMNWISDFVDLSGLDKMDLIHRFSLSTAEVENEILRKAKTFPALWSPKSNRLNPTPNRKNCTF